VSTGEIARWEVLGAIIGPPCRELDLVEWELTLRRRESRTDPGDPEKRRRAMEVEEARDMAKSFIESLELEYGIGRHCTARRRLGSNCDEYGQ
jgi:hypothetical protein